MSNQSNGGPQGRDSNELGSWIVTIVMLWAFFPVGVILLISKLKKAFRSPPRPSVSRPPQPAQSGQWRPVQPLEQRAARPAAQRAPAPAAPTIPAAPKASAPPAPAPAVRGRRKRRRASRGAWLYRLAGAGLLVLGILASFKPLEELLRFGFGTHELWRLTQAGGVAVGGLALLGVAGYKRRRENRYAAYLAVIGDSQCLSLDFIASATGRRYAAVQNDLQDMINMGYFGPESYLDLAERCFVACHAAAPRRDAKRAEDNSQPAEPAPRAVYPGRYAEEEQICSINKTISDPHVTACMNRLEELTHKILAYVEEHPEKESRIRRFRAHYLPKTIKICESYARFEQQGVQGENIRTAMQEVEDVMDSLVRGFENQLDMLFDDEALDVSTDISVLESMMAPTELKIEDFLPQREKTQ